jgi:hypothetical protein
MMEMRFSREAWVIQKPSGRWFGFIALDFRPKAWKIGLRFQKWNRPVKDGSGLMVSDWQQCRGFHLDLFPVTIALSVVMARFRTSSPCRTVATL